MKDIQIDKRLYDTYPEIRMFKDEDFEWLPCVYSVLERIFL